MKAQLQQLLQQATQQSPASVLALGNASVDACVLMARLHRRIRRVNCRNNWNHRSIIRGDIPQVAGA